MRSVAYSSKFLRRSRKLPLSIRKQVVKAEEKFRKDIYDPSLKTHKLTGEFKDYYSFSVNYSYRVLFSIEENGSVVFIDVGDHSIYQ